MKKIFLMLIFISIFFISCKKEYNGTKIIKLTYTTVDYNGGYTTRQMLDFKENKYYSKDYLPVGGDSIPDYELKKEFTEEEETTLINACYKNGLFNLKKEYKTSFLIYDGGGWTLEIEYEDGSIKESTGDNEWPSNIFNKCATYFYDVCGEEVLGSLPDYYAEPPSLSSAFSGIICRDIERANYSWNKQVVSDADLYTINNEMKHKAEINDETKAVFMPYTANYDYNKKFNKIVVTEYDYNQDLTNPIVLYEDKWFKQTEIKISINKIYTYELYYNDGNYVQYTFNTYCPE